MGAPGENYELPSIEVSWLKRDLLLFALTIGADLDELNFVFEQDEKFQAFPTYPNILMFKHTDQEVIDFSTRFSGVDIPGIPKFKPDRIIDGGQTISFYRSIPTTTAGRRFKLRVKILGVYDKGAVGSIMEIEHLLVDDESGEEYARIVNTKFYLGQGGWGGPKGPAPVSYAPPKGKKPDAVHTFQTTQQSALLYRLNGDYNPLHVATKPGKTLGFGGPIIHGLFSFNCVAHTILKEFGAGDPANMKEFSARFSSPVRPGDMLVTEMWRTSEFVGDFEDVRFVTKVQGKMVLSHGKALVRTVGTLSKL